MALSFHTICRAVGNSMVFWALLANLKRLTLGVNDKDARTINIELPKNEERTPKGDGNRGG